MRVGKTRSAAVVRPQAFTIIELLVVILVVAVIVAILLPAIQPPARIHTQELRDRTQIRGVMQGMVLYAQQNQDRYPLPSELDPNNTTTAAPGVRKDTTANIMSILIFEGFVPPELMVSPVEVNGNIDVDKDYEFDAPAAAVDPEHAQWDPAFAADFRVGAFTKGNVSYAHLLPHGERLANWKNTFIATTAQLANRGPEIAAITPRGDKPPTLTYASESSNTFAFQGSRNSWSGLVGFADGHVDLVDEPTEVRAPYAFDTGARPDVYFYDEPDDAKHLNAFLSVFVEPDADAQVQKAIWD